MEVGELALEEIYRLLRIDEAWSWRRPRGFSWIAHRLIQSTDASPVFESRGIRIARMVSRVTVVEDVRLPQTAAEKLVGAFNHLAVGSAYVYLSEDRRVDAIMAHIVHDETLKMRSKQIAAYQMLALAFAELHSGRLADAFQGKVATRQHPASGKRLQADDMLNVVAAFYRPAGALPSSFADGAAIEQVHQLVRKTHFFTAGGSADGITIEVALGNDDTTLIELTTDASQPHLGTGLGVFLRLRLNADEAQVARLANELNLLQLAAGAVVPAVGAWCLYTLDGRPSLGHAFFVPNAHVQGHVAADVHALVLDGAMTAIEQALWVDSVLHPNLPPRSSLPIVEKRLGLNLRG